MRITGNFKECWLIEAVRFVWGVSRWLWSIKNALKEIGGRVDKMGSLTGKILSCEVNVMQHLQKDSGTEEDVGYREKESVSHLVVSNSLWTHRL